MNQSISICLGCRAFLPRPFLDLGRTPLANSYLRPEDREPEDRFGLSVAYCPRCHLVQLGELVAPEKLFSEYAYFSSYSDSFLAHAQAMVADYVERFDLKATSRVLEVASNDGYLLQYFRQRGIQVLGVEPARNIAREAERLGIPTLERFFGPDAVSQIIPRFGRADMIIGNNVLAHVPEINGFIAAVAACMARQAAVVFEFPYLGDVLDKVEFDTIYHEHVFYYSLASIGPLVRRAQLELFDVQRQAVHGGSLRIFLQHPGCRPIAPSVARLLSEERANGLVSHEHYVSFGDRVERVKRELVGLLKRLKATGKRLAAYGAPAKGNTLLNYCGIDAKLLEFTVDRSPHKQGLLLPGSRLPILEPDMLLERQPDHTVILPWNIADEIIGQQREYVRRGGRFILPIPRPRVVEAECSDGRAVEKDP